MISRYYCPINNCCRYLFTGMKINSQDSVVQNINITSKCSKLKYIHVHYVFTNFWQETLIGQLYLASNLFCDLLQCSLLY